MIQERGGTFFHLPDLFHVFSEDIETYWILSCPEAEERNFIALHTMNLGPQQNVLKMGTFCPRSQLGLNLVL